MSSLFYRFSTRNNTSDKQESVHATMTTSASSANRKSSFDIDKIICSETQQQEKDTSSEILSENKEPGRIAQNLLDSVIESVLKSTRDDADDRPVEDSGVTSKSNTFHDIMNVSDYHILYNFVKTRLDIASFENEHLTSLARLLYDRSKELILHPNGVTNGTIKVLGRSLLHEVIGFHRNIFHTGENEFDCGCLLVKMLISYNADVNARDKYGTTPFHEAAAHHCERTLKMMLSTGRVDVTEKDSEGESALFYLVENIVESKIDDEQTELLVKQLEACLRILLENGVDFKETGRNGDTPFHRMLQNFYVSLPLVICFVEMCGPDISKKNRFGLTPMHVCARTRADGQFNRERIDILRYLCILSSKETLDLKDVSSKTALIHSVIAENKLLCRILFSNGADIQLHDKHGLSPFHYSCMGTDLSVVESLLDCDVDIYAKDRVGDAGIVYAAAHGRIDIMKRLYVLYQPSRELHNRLLTVADFNGHRECHEILKVINEWDIIDLNVSPPINTTFSPSPRRIISSGHKVEVEVREVDAWLRKKQEYLRKNRRLYFISPVEKFHILQSLRESENHDLCDAVTQLVLRVSEHVSQACPLFRFKPVLVGSMAEETKVDQVDSLEFHCEMYELSQNFEIVKAAKVSGDDLEKKEKGIDEDGDQESGEVLPGYTRIIAQNGCSSCGSDHHNHEKLHNTHDDCDDNIQNEDHATKQQHQQDPLQLVQRVDGVAYLSSYNVIRDFTRVVNDTLCDEEIWANLQLSWEPDTSQGQGSSSSSVSTVLNHNSSTITVHWVGKNYKYKKVRITLVPTVFSMEECPISAHLSKLLGGIGVIENARSAATRLIAQNVKSLDVDKPDLLWKEDYTPFELSIFHSVPECVLDGYKLSKLVRSERICPRLFSVSQFPKLSLKAVEYLPNQLLKTSLFYELTSRLDIGGLDYLRQTDAIGWAFHILNRIGNSVEKATSLPDFFDEKVNLRDSRTAPFVLAICKIGRGWLRHQWEDLYCGRKPPAEEKLLFSNTSSPKL